MIKSRYEFQILNFPLWVLALYFIIARREPADENYLAVRMVLLKDFYYSLPLPNNRVEGWLVKILINWIDREERNMHDLAVLENWSFKKSDLL